MKGKAPYRRMIDARRRLNATAARRDCSCWYQNHSELRVLNYCVAVKEFNLSSHNMDICLTVGFLYYGN